MNQNIYKHGGSVIALENGKIKMVHDNDANIVGDVIEQRIVFNIGYDISKVIPHKTTLMIDVEM